MNTYVDFIADKLVDVRIGSRHDVMMSIILPLLQKWKLPHLDALFEKLLSNAKVLRRESKFQVGEIYSRLCFIWDLLNFKKE
jgi:hypothetical protein